MEWVNNKKYDVPQIWSLSHQKKNKQYLWLRAKDNKIRTLYSLSTLLSYSTMYYKNSIFHSAIATINSWGRKWKFQGYYIYIHKVLSVSGVTAWSRGSGKTKSWEEEGYGECVSSGQVSFPAPSLQLSSTSDESLVLLYLSHSDEVELMATFTPADVISVVPLGSRRVEETGTPAGRFCCPPANRRAQCKNGLHQLINSLVLYLI